MAELLGGLRGLQLGGEVRLGGPLLDPAIQLGKARLLSMAGCPPVSGGLLRVFHVCPAPAAGAD